MTDLSKIPTEELMRMRGAPAAGADLSKLSTEQLMKMRGADEADPTGTFGQNLAAGAGKAIYDVARGGGQMLRQGIEAITPRKLSEQVTGNRRTVADKLGLPTQSDIDEARKLDAPLMNTGGGTVGNILGSAAMFAPTALIPGANTVAGAGLTGVVMGALQPTSGDESRLANTAIGGATGAAAQKVGGALIDKIAGSKAAAVTAGTTEQAQNAVRDAALKAGKDAGYVVPPSTIKSGLANETLESLGGKTATAQTASLKNQKVTDTLARQYLGMGDDAILSKAALADARNVAAEPYRQIAKISDEAKTALDAWKQANFESKMQWNYFRKSGNPDAYKAAQAAGDAAEQALNAVEQEAAKLVNGPGAAQYVDALKAARVKLAQLHTVESALTSGGHVDARLIAKMGERMPFQGELKTIADFAGNFPKAIQTPEKIGGMSHLLRPGIGAGIGTALGGPVGAAVGSVAGVAVPWTVREALLSGAGQKALTTPSYGPGMGGTVADMLSNAAVRRSLPAAGAAAGLNYRAQE